MWKEVKWFHFPMTCRGQITSWKIIVYISKLGTRNNTFNSNAFRCLNMILRTSKLLCQRLTRVKQKSWFLSFTYLYNIAGTHLAIFSWCFVKQYKTAIINSMHEWQAEKVLSKCALNRGVKLKMMVYSVQGLWDIWFAFTIDRVQHHPKSEYVFTYQPFRLNFSVFFFLAGESI